MMYLAAVSKSASKTKTDFSMSKSILSVLFYFLSNQNTGTVLYYALFLCNGAVRLGRLARDTHAKTYSLLYDYFSLFGLLELD